MNTHARALTLVEMLLTLTISTMVLGVLINSIILFYKANNIAVEQQNQIESARRGVQLLVGDIREASYGEDGSFPLAEMGSTSIAFFSETDGVAGTERIRYSLQGTSLLRNVTQATGNPLQYSGLGATTTVSQYIRNAEDNLKIFRYYNSLGAEVTSSLDIATVVYVTSSLVVDVTKQHTPGSFTLHASATMRNVRQQ